MQRRRLQLAGQYEWISHFFVGKRPRLDLHSEPPPSALETTTNEKRKFRLSMLYKMLKIHAEPDLAQAQYTSGTAAAGAVAASSAHAKNL